MRTMRRGATALQPHACDHMTLVAVPLHPRRMAAPTIRPWSWRHLSPSCSSCSAGSDGGSGRLVVVFLGHSSRGGGAQVPEAGFDSRGICRAVCALCPYGPSLFSCRATAGLKGKVGDEWGGGGAMHKRHCHSSWRAGCTSWAARSGLAPATDSARLRGWRQKGLSP